MKALLILAALEPVITIAGYKALTRPQAQVADYQNCITVPGPPLRPKPGVHGHPVADLA
jgi:hypothetical protein